MGIFINMIISKSVTREEWEKVYEETLLLVKKFPFAEKRKIKIHDVDTICLVPTEERETTYRWNREKTQIGWNTVCLLYTSPSPRDRQKSRMPSSA